MGVQDGSFSEKFESGVEAWRDIHGFNAGVIHVKHPIQPLTEAQMHARADEVFDEVFGTPTA